MARPVVFFDLSETLGSERRLPDGPGLAGFRPYPGVDEVLARLRPHARLGVLAQGDGLTPAHVTRVLGPMLAPFDPALVLAASTDSPTHFALAAERAGHGADPSQCVLVSPSRGRRAAACGTGFRTAPHPVLADALVQGRSLAYVRLAGVEPGRLSEALGALPVVGMHVDRASSTCYAAVDAGALSALHATAVRVDVLLEGDAVGLHDLYLLRTDHLDPAAAAGFRRRLEGQLALVTPARHGLVVAVPGGRSIDEFHPPMAPHGHTIEFMPTVTYFSRPASATVATSGRALDARTMLTDAERRAFARLTPATFRTHHEPWCGLAPGPKGDLIQSRNIGHTQNRDAVAGLADVLEAFCGNVRTPAVVADGRPLPIGNVEADLVGSTAPDEIVVLAAHLDSTAGNDPRYAGSESRSSAPGANDDGSGMAAVLAAAEILAGLAAQTRPRRTIRFMLFNAEEYGLKGSMSSAADLRVRQDHGELRVVAMLQMDMIGWTKATRLPRSFEVHAAGADYPDVEAESSRLADLVATAAGLVAPGLTAQRYPLAGCVYDPVAFRSDHNSFLAEGWPAVVVTEDEFAESCSTVAVGDPDYHLGSDRGVNVDYACDVARALAAAAWMLAADPVVPGPGAPEPEPPAPVPPPAPPASDPPPAPGTPDPAPSEPMPPDATPSDPTSATPEEKGTAMPKKFIHEFVRDFVSDENLRCRVLKAEVTGMRDYGLEGPQITALRSLDKQQILNRMIAELKDAFGLDLDQLRAIIWPGGDPPPIPAVANRTFASAAEAAAPAAKAASSLMASAESMLLYSEGQIHIRVVEPLQVPLNQTMDVTVRGQGFDLQPEIRFRNETSGDIETTTFVSSSCDVDVYQRIIVRVSFPRAGRWTVLARNQPTDPWMEGPATQRILVV